MEAENHVLDRHLNNFYHSNQSGFQDKGNPNFFLGWIFHSIHTLQFICYRDI